MQYNGRTRLSVAVLLSVALVLLAIAAPAGAAIGADAERASPANERSVEIWAYFDGDTPVSGGRVHVYADGTELSRDEPGPVTTFSGGEAMLRFDSLPSTLRIVVSGGRAGGEPVRGSLRTKVRGVTDGEIVHVNPVTTVSALLAQPEDGRSIRDVRNLTERTLGIGPILDDYDLYVTDRWFQGDRFRRWTTQQGSVGAGARNLVQLIERPGFDRHPFPQGGGGGPEARVGASAANAGNRLPAGSCEQLTGTGKEIIGGLVDALVAGIGLAVTLTGPGGFGVGAAGALFKGFVGLVDPCADKPAGEDPVHGALRALAAQVTQLQKQVSDIKDQVDQEFFQGQIAGASAKVRAIENTQAEFLSMLNWARDKDKAQGELESCQKHSTVCDRGDVDKARTSLVQREKFFLIGAEELAGPKDKAADYLNDALMGEKTAGSRAGLISGVRKQVGKRHFFTNESSEEIRSFLRYFEWAQTNLAAVLTEFYLLGGTCAKDFMTSHPGQLPTSPPCPADSGNAKLDVQAIKDNILKQRTMLPPKVLGDRVFIDRDNKTMWRVEPTHRTNPEILDHGLFCTKELVPDCQADLGYANETVFSDFPPFGGIKWYIPKRYELQQLFAGSGPSAEPLARLISLGVREPLPDWCITPPQTNDSRCRSEKPLAGPAYFWTRGDFYLRKLVGPLPGSAWHQVDRIDATVFKLAPGGKSPVEETWKLASNCGTTAGARPTCRSFTPGLGAEILWFRRLSDADGAYWCRPDRTPSWDPATC